MQYLVHTKGIVAEDKSKSYIIAANEEKTAQEIAKKYFAEENYSVGDEILVRVHKRTATAIASYVLLLIPILLSFINWKVGHDTVSIMPDLISTLCAVGLYSSYIVRFKGVHRTVGSWIDIVFCVLLILLISSFIKIIMFEKVFELFFLDFSINTTVIVIGAIVLSWIGLKLISVLCMICIVLIAMANIISLNAAMGGAIGTAYIICSFLGILLYLSIEPAVYDTIPYIRKSIRIGKNRIHNDFIDAGNSVKQTIGKIYDNKAISKNNNDLDK